MSVSSTTNKIIYTGSGTTGPFDFDFRIFESSDLVVEKYTIATGATTTLTITTDYTVTIDPDDTGYVTTIVAVTSAYKLIIRRVLPLTQEIDYVEGDKFPAETHEEGLDRSRMVDQQLQEQIDRAVLQNPTVSTQITLPGAVTGEALVWASDGTLENSDLTGPQGPQGETGPAGADGVFSAIASEAEAQAGSENTKGMTPLRTAQAITALQAATPVKATGAEINTGTNDDKFATPKAIKDSNILKTGLGSWATIDLGTVYQAATDGFVTAWFVGNPATLVGRTDGSNPPVGIRQFAKSIASAHNSISFPVRKGDYYLLDKDGSTTTDGAAYFISLA
jgi:hypothetical protein